MKGHVGRTLPTHMALGLGQESTGEDLVGVGVPGRGGGIWSEANQRHFYRHWQAYLAAETTDELRERLAEVNH